MVWFEPINNQPSNEKTMRWPLVVRNAIVLENQGAFNPCFIFFHGHYNNQKCVSNARYMKKKISTNGYN